MLSVVDDTNLFISGLCANETDFYRYGESHNVWFRYNQLTPKLSQLGCQLAELVSLPTCFFAKHVGSEIMSLLLQGKHIKGLTQPNMWAFI